MAKRSPRGTQSSQPPEPQRRRFWQNVPIIIALVGGVPGIVGVWREIQEYRNKSSVHMVYDPSNSMATRISAEQQSIDGNLALLLYDFHLAGKGSERSYVRDMTLLVRCNDTWTTGERFTPVQADMTDPLGVTKKAVHLISGSGPSRDDIWVAGWENFVPGKLAAGYGEPIPFSYAARFEIRPPDFERCDMFKIRVDDYLGNTFTENMDAGKLFQKAQGMVLDQKPRKDN